MKLLIVLLISIALCGVLSPKEYVIAPQMDIYDHDIKQVKSKTVEELKVICEETSGCVGFNTHGWLKSSARNMKHESTVDFYYFADVIEPQAAALPIHIWPMPKHIESGTTKVYIDRPSFQFNADRANDDLNDAIQRYTNLIFYSLVNKQSKHFDINRVNIIVNDLDAPLQHRSVLVDTARHYLPISVILKTIDSLAYAKYNIFHWHITDDDTFPLEIKKHPSIWDKGAYIPDMCPSPQCVHPLNPTSNITLQIIDDIITELTGGKNRSGLFFDDYIHLGGDEVEYYCWDHTQRVIDWMNNKGWKSADVYKYLIDSVTQIALRNKRIPIVWEDVFLSFGDKLDKNTIIHVWYRKYLFLQALQKGYRAILSVVNPWYLDYPKYTWHDMYKLEPTDGIPEDLHHLIMGGGPNLWSEKVWPKAAAPAEILWTPKDKLDIDKALQRLQWFRCHLNKRDIGAGAVNNNEARQPPPNQDSCYLQ